MPPIVYQQYQRFVVYSDRTDQYPVDSNSRDGVLIRAVAVAPSARWVPPHEGRLYELELEAMRLASRLTTSTLVGAEERRRIEDRMVELDGLREGILHNTTRPRPSLGRLQIVCGTEVKYTGDLVALMDNYGKNVLLDNAIQLEPHHAVRLQLQSETWSPIRGSEREGGPVDVPPVVEVVLSLAIARRS